MEGLTELENAAVGAASAGCVAVTLQPTLYWKNAAAQASRSHPSRASAAASLPTPRPAPRQGLPFTLRPSLLFRGCGANLLKETSEMALQFAAAGRMKAGGDASSSAAREIAGAVGGGAVGALLVTPFECVMVQQQLLGTSLLQTPLDIVRRHGALDGLYRGLGLAALRDSIYVGCMLGLTPVVRRRLIEGHELPPAAASLCASAVGGVAGGVFSHPMDVVKTCMQGDLARAVHRDPLSTCRNLIAEGGIGALMRGAGWRTLNITLTVFIAGEVCQRLPPYLLRLTRRAEPAPAPVPLNE